jgi:GT2 family glycosyltransferase
MTNHAPTVSVVICTYATERFHPLLSAFDSVRRQSRQPAELAVVVDHNPALLRRVRGAAPDVLSITNDEARGLSGARNCGISATRGAIVAFLDDDAFAESDWLERLVAPYADPDVVGVGGAILADWLTGRPAWFPDEFAWVVGCTYRGMPIRRAAVRNVIGANMSFRREVFAAAGGFAPEMGRTDGYPLGNDDTEFCIRARQALPGRQIVYEPHARVWHRVPEQRASWRYFRTRCYAEGLAKAALTSVTGATEGLSSERIYSTRVLPRGVVRNLGHILAGDRSGARRSITILAGLSITLGGYVSGKLRPHVSGRAAGATRELARLSVSVHRRSEVWRSQPAVHLGRPFVPVVLALALWSASLPQIDLGRISDFGLLPALPWTFYTALAVLTVGFTLVLRASALREGVLALHVAALVLIIHATPSIAYGTLRYSWAWKHVGIVDYIQRHGSVDPNIQFLSAYHNWPGFFALSALYTELAGFPSALAFASWAPTFFNLLFVAVLVVLFGALTPDRRRVWLATWFFAAANWIGQDYFSPQAFAYFLFLVIVTICIAWFRVPRPSWLNVRIGRPDAEGPWHSDAGTVERGVLAVLLLLLTAVIASSHQLTPFMTVLALTGLVLIQNLRLRSLPPTVAVISLGWVVLLAVGFLRGNLYWIADSVGTLTTNANSTLINLAAASHGERVIARIDRALTLSVWLLGALGFVRGYRRGRLELAAGVLAIAPFAMLAVTSYGGEILFRVFFFALPFFALLAAGLFVPGATRRAGVATALVSGALLAGLLAGYYGNERQNYFTKDEVNAARFLYATAPAGSLLVSGVNNYPWAFEHYEEYSYLALADLGPRDRRHAIADPAQTIAAIAHQGKAACTYVVITSSEEAAVDMSGVMPQGSLARIEHLLGASGLYRLVLQNPSATIFGLVKNGGGTRCPSV